MAEDNPAPDTHESPGSEPVQRHTSMRDGLKTIAVLASALIFALLMIGFVFQSYQVSGQSMQNTLQDQDRLLVWKLPRTWASITGHQYVPKRGDILIINAPNLSACEQSGRQIIKRVIGLPGERVRYQDGKYTVYNRATPKGFNPDATLPYGKTGLPLFSDSSERQVDVSLGPNQLFVSGDHRGNSCDSRSIGPITTDEIVGKLLVRILPLNKAERF